MQKDLLYTLTETKKSTDSTD